MTNQANVEWYRRMNSATRLCTTGENVMTFRAAGLRLDRCNAEDFAAANLALQPIDAPEFIPAGMTCNSTDQYLLRGAQ